MILLLAAILPVLASGDAVRKPVKLPVPRVEYRMNEASATPAPGSMRTAGGFCVRPAFVITMMLRALAPLWPPLKLLYTAQTQWSIPMRMGSRRSIAC